MLATATGLAVAGIYYAQPLLPDISRDLGLSGGGAGFVVTITQLGYAAGLVLLVPLGDLIERRRLVVVVGAGAALALALQGSAPSLAVLLPAAILVGLFSAQAQVLVALAAALASARERGRVVGSVMSGLLLGILLARTVAGALAALGSWRLVYLAAAGAMLVQALVLARMLPRSDPEGGLGYRALLGSIPAIVREQPLLRRRSLFGALSMAGFSVLWTSVAFLLARPPYGYGSAAIGLFGLVGAAGAMTANLTGRLADRGRSGLTTAAASALLALSWVPLALGERSLGWLVAGILVLDVAVQAMQISNQSVIYSLAPEARSRINSAYMTTYFAGGAIGSAASAAAWDAGGWDGVCLVGGAFGLGSLAVWALSRARAARSR